jgi:hypothetical protein
VSGVIPSIVLTVAEGRLEVFIQGTDDATLAHVANFRGGGVWLGWNSIGGEQWF